MKVTVKYIKIIRLLIIFCFVILAGKTNAQSSVRISDTIPYEIKGGKIILSIRIEDKPTKFIFDTGGVNLITSDSAKYHDVKVLGKEVVADVNSRNSSFYKGALSNVNLSKHIKMSSMETLITPPQGYFRDLGVAGALGGEAFANVCVTFFPKEQFLVLTHPYRPAGISRKEGLKMNMGNTSKSIFPLQIAGVELPTLFDTGMSDFLHLNTEDYVMLKDLTDIKVVAEGEGLWHVGIHGVKDIETEKVEKIILPSFRVANKTFTNVGVLTQNAPLSIIGLDLLKYGQVILDYPRGLFYFYPFEEKEQSLAGKYKIWNVNILPIKDHFEVTAIIGNVDCEMGEWVWNINGTDLSEFPMDQGKIIDLMDQIETEEAYMLVGKDKTNLKKVIIKKI